MPRFEGDWMKTQGEIEEKKKVTPLQNQHTYKSTTKNNVPRGRYSAYQIILIGRCLFF